MILPQINSDYGEQTFTNPIKINTDVEFFVHYAHKHYIDDHLCGLVVRASGYSRRRPGLDSRGREIF
jgi:hypothetical protein